jgi:hypothetical protein
MERNDVFDVGKWMVTRSRLSDPVPITQPKQLIVWTKTSKKDGGGRFLFGDASGAMVASASGAVPLTAAALLMRLCGNKRSAAARQSSRSSARPSLGTQRVH